MTMDVSVVIPAKDEASVLTTESLPDTVDDVLVSTVPGPSCARNDGIIRAEHDRIVVMDDDLRFDPSWFECLADRVADNPDYVYAARGTGILADLSWPQGFEPGITRVMACHKHVWDDVGGFDSPNQIPSDPDYGSDTDFLMSAYERGYTVEGIEHEWTHEDETDSYTTLQNLSWLVWLTSRHVSLVGPRIPQLLRRWLLT